MLHIELRKWADLLCVAPLSADFLAKIVNGLVNGLLGGVVRAWENDKKWIVAPAMNTAMWEKRITADHIKRLVAEIEPPPRVLEPVEKRLACGDVGRGAMAEWCGIVDVLVEELGLAGQIGKEDGDNQSAHEF